MAVGAAAPTFAASRPCPTFPPGSDWNTRITAGRPSSIGGGYGWGGNTFSVFRDATTSGGFTLTSSTTISGLIAGQTYTMEVAIGWNYGNSSASSSTAAGARIRVDGTEVLSGQTRTADLGGTPGRRRTPSRSPPATRPPAWTWRSTSSRAPSGAARPTTSTSTCRRSRTASRAEPGVADLVRRSSRPYAGTTNDRRSSAHREVRRPKVPPGAGDQRR
ncbi:hypothetical protein [Barrientosiimonas endolithica]|uniref:hypothetical protein n=1 Tax=Barrientosiimonas endolithica TaxID=1535208 RepID=UPI00259B1F42|nr:hypothetical protein [Barrientosiimonas endolithica]